MSAGHKPMDVLAILDAEIERHLSLHIKKGSYRKGSLRGKEAAAVRVAIAELIAASDAMQTEEGPSQEELNRFRAALKAVRGGAA